MSKPGFNSKSFQSAVNPFGQKYIEKVYDPYGLFDEPRWVTKNGRLDPRIVNDCLQGKCEHRFGYLGTTILRAIVLDIDDHESKAEWQLTYKLQRNYWEIVEKLCSPSILFQTRRGLHLYYILYDKIPDRMAELYWNALFGKGESPAELRGTSKKAISFPSNSRCIDPRDFSRVESFLYSEVRRFGVWELFENNITDSLEDKQKSVKGFRRSSRLDKIEKEYPIFKGDSNESFKKLASAYFLSGLQIEEASTRLLSHLTACGYEGELTNKNRRESRLKSSFRNLSKNGFDSSKRPGYQLEIGDESWVNMIVNKSPFSRTRKKALRNFLENLLRWNSQIESVKGNDSELTLWAFLYPTFRRNVRLGLIPLPKSLYSQWVKNRPHEILDYLKEIKVLRDSGMPYRFITGTTLDLKLNPRRERICKYYEFNKLSEVKESREEYAYKVLLDYRECMSVEKIAYWLQVSKKSVYRYLSGDTSMPKKVTDRIHSLSPNLNQHIYKATVDVENKLF